MQTFLPFRNFKRSASVLDRQRLGKQRVETMQIMHALIDPNYGWQNHPAVNMWRNHEHSLYEYQVAICREWTSRGYKDTCLAKTLDLLASVRSPQVIAPAWLGLAAFHRSHQSNLIRKDELHYRAHFPSVPGDLDYYWPTKE